MHKHSSILRVNSSFPESSKSLVMLCYIRSEIKLLSETQYWPREGFISSHLFKVMLFWVSRVLDTDQLSFRGDFRFRGTMKSLAQLSRWQVPIGLFVRKLVVFARKGVNFSYSIYCSQWFLLRLLSIWGLGASKINFRKGHFYDSEEASLS